MTLTEQLGKQTDCLGRLEQVLQPLWKIAKGLDVQSKVVKEITSSVKQLQTQIIQNQKSIQKGTTRRQQWWQYIYLTRIEDIRMAAKKKKSSKKKK
jgi:uncharacterized protein YoxC